MILFLKDWAKYPNAIVHTSTKNETFLKMGVLLREMGVKNHAFLLSLHNPKLENIDPHDTDNLTPEMMRDILIECKENPWYYFREVALVPPVSGLIPSKLRANRANIALYWLFFNHITTILIQPRQTGKSLSTDELFIYLLNIGAASTFINLLTANDSLRAINLTRLKRIQDELPFYLNMRTNKDIFNTEIITIKNLNNTYKGNLSNSSEKLANSAGRGFTSPILHVDEAIIVPNIKIALEAALMAGNAARDEAKRNGNPYGTILTTTTGDIDDRDASYVYNLWDNSTPMNEKFYDCVDEEDLINMIINNSRSSGNNIKRIIVNITRSYKQLGYTDEWMKEKIQETIADGSNADRDLFNRWTRGSTSSPIPKEYREAMNESIRDDYRTEIFAPHNYIIRHYIDEYEFNKRCNDNVHFIIGVDTSDAVGRDDIAFTLRDHTNGELISVGVFNDTNLITIADFFYAFMMKYPNTTMIIERKSSAITIIDYLIQKFASNNVNPFKRLFNMVFQQPYEHEKEFSILNKNYIYDLDVYSKYKKFIGFATSATGITSRSTLYSTTLINMCKYTSKLMYDRQLISQINSLIVKNNRIDHPDGGHDDLVMSSLLSYWLLTNGVNLNLYGIDGPTILKRNNIYLEEKYSSAQLEKEEIEEIEQKLNYYLNEYKNETDSIVMKQLELKIKTISKELNMNYNKSIAIEQVLDDINKEKRMNKIKRYY